MSIDALRLARAVVGALAVAGPALASNAGAAEGLGHFHSRGPGKDDCAPDTRHRKAEWGPEFCRAKLLSRLDCRGLAAHAEGLRHSYNVQALTLYNRPWGGMPAPEPPPSTAPAIDSRVPVRLDGVLDPKLDEKPTSDEAPGR